MTASPTPWTASGMKEANASLETPMRNFLRMIVRDNQDHGQFLNMLAMLEHMGSRKIMVSQMNKPEAMSQDTLQHMAEEARHAYFFKRHAERIAGKELEGWTDVNTMCRAPALMYFGRMDAGISKTVTPDDPYPWVSLIIELRACWLYHIYNEVVEEAGIHLPLKSILAEEDQHLEEMFEACGENTSRLQALSAYETGLFNKLFVQLRQAQDLPLAA